jgi:peptidoglycan/xylan/chitin deacetylase (PgdA/CDA1 family)
MISSVAMEIYAGLGAAGALALGAGGFSYASLSPGSTIFGRALIAPRQHGEIALTFDDGPNTAWTPRLLDVLAEHGVKATFFMMGSRAEQEPELVRRVAAGGHLVGNHSWSHPNLAQSAASKVREELTRTSAVLEQITGERVLYFRPPFGGRRPVVLKIARDLGLTPVLWNAMTTDWEEPSAEKIADRLSGKIDALGKSGSAANVVMHDGGHLMQGANRGPSTKAAEILVKKYRDNLQFVLLDAWAVD